MPPQRNVEVYLLLFGGEGCMLPWANKYHLQALLVILLHPAININYHLHTSDDDELWRGFIEERWADKLSPYHREIIQHVRAALPSRLCPPHDLLSIYRLSAAWQREEDLQGDICVHSQKERFQSWRSLVGFRRKEGRRKELVPFLPQYRKNDNEE